MGEAIAPPIRLTLPVRSPHRRRKEDDATQVCDDLMSKPMPVTPKWDGKSSGRGNRPARLGLASPLK
jgi:hypothetical protein